MRYDAMMMAAVLLGAGCGGAGGPGKAASPGATGEASGPAPAPLEVGKYARVYRGDGGLRVTIVPVTSHGADERALIEVSGVQTPIDSVVLLYDKTPGSPDRYSFATTLNGSRSNTVWFSSRWGDKAVEVYLPNAPTRAVRVAYDEDESKKVVPRSLAERHARQVGDGTIARLQKFDRDGAQRRQAELVAELVGPIEKGCGKRVEASVDWATVDDDFLKQHSVSGYCEPIRRAAERLCSDAEGKKAFFERVARIRCQVGKQTRARLDDNGTLVWEVSRDGTNLDERARAEVLGLFGRDQVALQIEGTELVMVLDPGDPGKPIHWGYRGKALHEHRETANSASGRHRWLWAGPMRSELSFDKGTWTLTCGKRLRKLSELTGTARDELLAAKQAGQRWQRQPYALARDDRGRYYYVDRMLDKYGGKGFRVFMGLKGRLKLTRLVDIVNDSDGTIFATRNGKLRLLVDHNGAALRAAWIDGRKRRPLDVLSPGNNARLIYRELGVYDAENLGSVCDEL